MPIEVTPVQDSRELETFIRFPWQIYKGNPNWVPPLLSDMRLLHDPKRNPFFEHSITQNFLARENGRVVGRVTAIRNGMHNKFHEDTVGFFGCFECERRPDVARALVKAAAGWLKERGLTSMRGPMNFSTNDDCGLLIQGFERPPVLMMPYNPEWYAELLEGAGLAKVKDLLAYYLDDTNIPPRLLRISDKIQRRRNIKLTRLDMKNFDREVDRIRDVYNDAWERNWSFAPMTERELKHMAAQLKPAVDPELVVFADIAGETVAFALAMPDLYQALKPCNGRLFPFGLIKFLWAKRGIRTIRVLALGIKAGHRNVGVDALLFLEIYKRGLARGYNAGEFSWILEDNIAIRRPIENIGAKVYKRYRIYEAPVEALA